MMDIRCKDSSMKDVLANYVPIQSGGKPTLLAIVRDIAGQDRDKDQDFSRTIKVLR